MKTFLVIIFCCFELIVGAQMRANYELAEKSAGMFLPWSGDQIEPNFIPGSDNFWFYYTQNGKDIFYFVDVKAKKIEELFDREKLAQTLTSVLGKEYDPNHLKFWGKPIDKTGVEFTWVDDNCFFRYNRVTKELKYEKLSSRENQPKIWGLPIELERYRNGISPDGNYQLFGKDYNIYLRDSSEIQLTFDGKAGYGYAGEQSTKREVKVVATWFDDAKNFYVERYNTSSLEKVYHMNYLKGRPVAYGEPMALAGDSVLMKMELSLFNVDNKKQVKVDLDKWQDQACRVVYMDKKRNKLYLERRTRRNDVVEICDVDLQTGAVKVIIHEEEQPYVPVELASIHFCNDNKDIIWWSERTGYGHLYRYDSDGSLQNAITTGNWTVGRVLGFDRKQENIYFEAYGIVPGENPNYPKICRARLDGRGCVVVLTPEEASHKFILFPSGKYIIDMYSRPDMPNRFEIRDNNGKFVMNLLEQDVSGFTAQGWKAPELFSVKAADGMTDLYGVMWKPFDFDSTIKYPVISCVYPGPQTDNVPLTFDIGSMNERLAQIGFIVVAFNHRGGLPWRGKDYHCFGYNNIRDFALEDDKVGLEQLIDRYDFIDGDKVGIYGHSGGGMMSAAAICTYPDFYKVCVSSAGNYDNNIYLQSYVEGHFAIGEQVVTENVRMAKDNGRDIVVEKQRMKFSVNLPTVMDLVPNLKGHLMLVVGGMDGNVHPANTFRMVNALVKNGKDFELVYLPECFHTYDKEGDWYFQRKLWSYFGKYLLGDFSSKAFYDIEFDPLWNKVNRK